MSADLICLASGLIDPATATPRRAMIRAAVRAMVDRPLYPVAFGVALASVMRAAHREQAQVRAVLASRADSIRAEAEHRRDAEQLAAFYSYDADRLQHELNRRSFGSFTTALDGTRPMDGARDAAMAVIRQIADRAVRLYAEHEVRVERQTILMNLMCCHFLAQRLRLDDLLAADDLSAADRRVMVIHRPALNPASAQLAPTCYVCAGEGHVPILTHDGEQTPYTARCPHCSGVGRALPPDDPRPVLGEAEVVS